jgi:hypothetical protein
MMTKGPVSTSMDQPSTRFWMRCGRRPVAPIDNALPSGSQCRRDFKYSESRTRVVAVCNHQASENASASPRREQLNARIAALPGCGMW